MSDGMVCKTETARSSWYRDAQALHRTRRGTYWLEHLDADKPWAEYLDKIRAALWLHQHNTELPEDLIQYKDGIEAGVYL
jgi:hypothetical protein